MSSKGYKRKAGDKDYRRSSSGYSSSSKYSRSSSSTRPVFGKPEDYLTTETLFEKTKISSMRYRHKTHTNGDPSFRVDLKGFKEIHDLRKTINQEVMLIKFYPSRSKPKDTLLPVGMELFVNGMKLEMPPINDKIEGRMNCPIEVNPELLQLENYIRISSLELEEEDFSFAVVVAERTKPKEVSTKKEGKWNVKSKEDVIEEIKKKLGKDSSKEDDDIVATSTIVLKLTCPLGMSRMTTPARFQNCTHLNCFEITTFSKMKKKEKCPYCLQPVSMKQVFVDGYMKEICEKSKNDTVQLNHDGTWQEVEDKNEKCEEIADDDDEEEEIIKNNAANYTTIDLCSSTDEDGSSSDDDDSPCNCADCQGGCNVIELSD